MGVSYSLLVTLNINNDIPKLLLFFAVNSYCLVIHTLLTPSTETVSEIIDDPRQGKQGFPQRNSQRRYTYRHPSIDNKDVWVVRIEKLSLIYE